jgi:opacity protein-like surface antigen
MMRFFLLLLLPAGLFAQFTAGVKAGVPLTDFFDTVSGPNFGFSSDTKRYLIGPTIELRLPGGLGIEVDALYRRFNYTAGTTLAGVITNSRTTGNAWEFPLLVKYRFPGILARPFLGVGANFDTFTGLKQTVARTVGTVTSVVTNEDPPERNKEFNKGFLIGGGVEIRALFISISPEIRYTRWGSEPFRSADGSFRSSRNQAEFLVGFTF